MKHLTKISLLAISTLAINSCALVTVPLKVAGKAATTSIGTAGKVAGAGINAIIPNGSSEAE